MTNETKELLQRYIDWCDELKTENETQKETVNNLLKTVEVLAKSNIKLREALQEIKNKLKESMQSDFSYIHFELVDKAIKLCEVLDES